jgi:hypothetical protein
MIYFKLRHSQVPAIERDRNGGFDAGKRPIPRGTVWKKISANFSDGANLDNGDQKMLGASMTRFFNSYV